MESACNGGGASTYFRKLVEIRVGTERSEMQTARKKRGVEARN